MFLLPLSCEFEWICSIGLSGPRAIQRITWPPYNIAVIQLSEYVETALQVDVDKCFSYYYRVNLNGCAPLN